MGPSVLVIGAGGNFGSAVMKEFIQQKSKFSRVAILTDPARKDKFNHFKEHEIELILGSYFDSEMYKGFEVIISLAGNAIMKDQPGMIDAAAAGGAKHFYPSEYGADLSIPALANVRYFSDKQLTRKHLAQKVQEDPSFRYTLLITAGFTEWALSPFFGVDTEKHTVELYGNPDAQFDSTSLIDAAKYLVSSILIPWGHSGSSVRTLRVRGSSMTWRQLVDTLGEIQGVKYTYQRVDPAVAHEKEKEAREAGDFDTEMAWSARPLATSGNAIVGSPINNDLFDFKPETAKETLQRIYGKQ